MKTPQTPGGRKRGLLVCLGLLAGLVSAHASWNPADVLGPDGLVYPDFSRAGIPGGIPTPTTILADLTANTGQNISPLIESAVAGSVSGGVIKLGTGTYYLDRPITVFKNNIIIRGAGQDLTKVISRYAPPTNNVAFFQPSAGITTLQVNTWIEIHADPVGLTRLTIKANGVQIAETTASAVGTDWNGTFALTTRGDRVFATLRDATGYAAGDAITLVAEAEYENDPVVKTVSRGGLTYTNQYNYNHPPSPSNIGVINIAGLGLVGSRTTLAQSATRGAVTVTTSAPTGFVAGSPVYIAAPITAEWNAETGNACPTDLMRHYLLELESLSGSTLTFKQPLRIDYPLPASGAAPYVQAAKLVTGCGVESLTIEQNNDLWTHGIVSSWSKECWVKNVRVTKTGRSPVNVRASRACEVRDSIFDRCRNTGLGGTGYVGFGLSFDCLMENITTIDMRHSPCVQWAAAGNVIRNSTFTGGDMQWHGGWANENLFENCVVLSNLGTGAYGYGMWSAPPEDAGHGPIGPRNVVYNCDLASNLAGAWMGGSNKGWTFAYNRIASDLGNGLLFREGSGDHALADNLVVLGRGTAGIQLEDADCTGTRAYDNTFNGVPPGALVVGQGALSSASSNNATSDWLAPVAVPDAGFENGFGTNRWTLGTDDNQMSSITSAAARGGSLGLRVVDNNPDAGSSVYSQPFAVTPGRVYATRFWQYIHSGENLAVYLRFYAADGTPIALGDRSIADNTIQRWTQLVLTGTAPIAAATARIWVHSFNGAVVTGYLDDFEFGEAPEALPNGDFEQGIAHWTVPERAGNTVEAIAAAARTGAGLGLRVTDTNTAQPADALSRAFPISPGQEAQVRFWAICRTPFSAASSGIAVQLVFYSGSTQLPNPGSTEVPVGTPWLQHTVRGVAPAGADSVRLWIRGYTSATTMTDFDDFSFLVLPPRPLPPVPSLYEWQRNPVLPLENPGFEQGLSGWTLKNDNNMSTVSSAAAYSGSLGLRVADGDPAGGSSLESSPFAAQPGAQYLVAFRARLESGTGIGVYVRFYDAAGAPVPPQIAPLAINGTAWAERQLTITAPAGAVTGRVWIHSYDAWTATACFDDFSVRRL